MAGHRKILNERFIHNSQATRQAMKESLKQALAEMKTSIHPPD